MWKAYFIRQLRRDGFCVQPENFSEASLICPDLISPLPTTKQNPHPELLNFSQLRPLFHWHAPASTS